MPFDLIDSQGTRFYAIDGSRIAHGFYNGISLCFYQAGYVCFQNGRQLRMNANGDPVVLGKVLHGTKMLVLSEKDLFDIYDEFLSLPAVSALVGFFGDPVEDIFPYDRDIVTKNSSVLLNFCQEVLEWACVYEIVSGDLLDEGDIILCDGTLRSLNIKQRYLVKLGYVLHEKKANIVAVTKQSPIKTELAYTYSKIDNYLQSKLKPEFPFKTKDTKRQKLCCYFEVRDDVLEAAYSGAGSNMYAKKDIVGGRGFGLFFAARLDYVEKLQNYDWLICDLNIYDCIPNVANKSVDRDPATVAQLMFQLTATTQEHYILGFPIPLLRRITLSPLPVILGTRQSIELRTHFIHHNTWITLTSRTYSSTCIHVFEGGDMERKDFGVLYGQKTTEDALLIYSSYEDAKASPSVGDFIVLSPKNEGGTKYLARVEAEVYDEDPLFRSQDKTLVAVHYARIAERELSDRDKQKMFSYTYKVRMLGTFVDTGASISFTTAVRKLPVVSYIARHLNASEVAHILNMGNEKGVEIGHLCIGEDVQKEKGQILFDTTRLKSKRTMVFAQSGFGKTNFVKVLLCTVIGDNSFGKLVFDLNGEYYSKTASLTVGLGDVDDAKIRQNLVVYSDRKIGKPKGFTYGGKVQVNTHKHMTVGDILTFSAGFSEVMKSFLLYLDDKQVEGFINKIDSYCDSPQNLYKDFPDFFGSKNEGDDKKQDKSARGTIMAIRKRIRHFIDEGGVHSSTSTLMEDTFKLLKQGKTVVIDLSLRDSVDASIISTMIVRKLFEDNKKNYTEARDEQVIPTVIIVEEAQNVLSDEQVKTSSNPFVRVAKEGRKFGIGLVAITQRPSAISEEIRSQAENFFTFYMGNSDDIKALVKSNVNYDGVVSSFIQRETIPGNLYFVTSSHPFVIPVRVLEFDKMVENRLYK